MQTALQNAIDVKLAKEGEVSVLRKSVEKVFFLQFSSECPLILMTLLDISNPCSPNSTIKG